MRDYEYIIYLGVALGTPKQNTFSPVLCASTNEILIERRFSILFSRFALKRKDRELLMKLYRESREMG